MPEILENISGNTVYVGTTNGLHLDSPERKYFLLLWPIERITPKDNQRFFFKSDRLVVVLSTNILPRKFNWLSEIFSKKFFWLTFTTCNLTNWAYTICLDMYAARHKCCQLWLFLDQVKKKNRYFFFNHLLLKTWLVKCLWYIVQTSPL